MDAYLQIGLGAVPVMLIFLALSIFSKKSKVRNIILTVVLAAAVGFFAGPSITTLPSLFQGQDGAARNTSEANELNPAYAIAAEGSPELAKSLLDDMQLVYMPEYALASARFAAAVGDFRTANILYMKAKHYFPEAELNLEAATRDADNVPYTAAARHIIYAENIHKAYLLGEYDDAEDSDDSNETRRQLRQINTFMQENPAFSAIPTMRLARLKLQILCEEYKAIAANVNEHSDHNELLIVSELLLNNYVRQSDFTGEFSTENTAKYEVVFNKLNDIYNSHFQDKSRDERNAARAQLQALRTAIRNPALGKISEELSKYADSEYSVDASKVFMQKAKIEHSLGNEAKVAEYLDRSFDTVGDCEDFSYVIPMYELVSIITDKDDAGRVQQAADFVNQVLENNMTIKTVNLSENRMAEERGSNEDDSLRGEFSLQMQTYVSQKRMAVNIVTVDISQFGNNNTVKATVNISNNLYTSPETLKSALSVRDCGIDIADFTVEKVSYTRANILLCLDVSGSMAGNNKIGMLREAVRYFAQDMADIENIAIVEFDSSILRQHPFGLSSDEIMSIADSLYSNGGTNMYDALIGSIAQFPNNAGEINSIILMSDGMDGSPRSLEDIVQNISDPANAKGITIYSIGFGDDADHEYLSRFSSTTGGAYLFAAEPDATTQLNQLEAFFDGLRAQILNQYAITFSAVDSISQSRELVVSVDSELNRDRVRYRLGGGADSIIDSDEDTDSPIFFDGKAVYGFEPRQLFKNGQTLSATLRGEGFADTDSIGVALRGTQLNLYVTLSSNFVDANNVTVSIPAGIATDVYDVIVTINGKSTIISRGLFISQQGVLDWQGIDSDSDIDNDPLPPDPLSPEPPEPPAPAPVPAPATPAPLTPEPWPTDEPPEPVDEPEPWPDFEPAPPPAPAPAPAPPSPAPWPWFDPATPAPAPWPPS